jgi:heme/copper-type cytochrome/quinol oxidase subunit 2
MKLAGTFNDVIGRISAPPVVENLNQGDATGVTGINNFLTTMVSLFFLLASIALVFMVVWGAYDYIISFGEKENISKARQKITWAIVGFIILSLSFAIFKVLEQITGVKFLVV